MVQRITIAPQGPEFSRFVMGYWRLMDWNMSARQLVSFIEEHLDLGVTTVDHADIYGGYQCEAAFGEALKLAPHLRERMEIVSKDSPSTTEKLSIPMMNQGQNSLYQGKTLSSGCMRCPLINEWLGRGIGFQRFCGCCCHLPTES